MDQHEVRDGKPEVNKGRRKLIKAAAIAGGAAAAVGALPGNWKKPLATVGGLPAHAQTSDAPITIPDNSVVIETNPGDARAMALKAVLPTYSATFGYIDPLCQIDETATLWVQVGPCGTLQFNNETLQSIGAGIVGDSCDGTIQFGFQPCDMGNGSIAIQLSKGARHSNVVNASFLIGNVT